MMANNFTPEQQAALDAMCQDNDARIKRWAEKDKKKHGQEESMLQTAVTSYLNANWPQERGQLNWELPHWAVRNELPPVPFGEDPELWAIRQGAKANRMGRVKGVHDYHFLYDSKFRTIELKAPGKKLSPDQRVWGENIKRHGGEYHCCDSVEAVHKIISTWLPVRYDPPACNERSKRQMTMQVAQKELNRNDD